MESSRDRALGVLLGLAAGDRNGGPIRMAIRVAESLRDRRRFDLNDILGRYLAWWRDGAFDTGPTSATVLGLIERGLSPAEAAERVHEQTGGMTAGCNPAHRAAPLAMAAFLADDQLAHCAIAEAGLTHRAPLAGDVAAAVVTLCRALIRGVPWDAAVSCAAAGRLEATVRALDPASPVPLSAGGFAPDVLRAAIHFVRKHSSFSEALTASLLFAGPANYSPVLVGAIGGARWGEAVIPARHLARCETVMRAESVAESLANEWDTWAAIS